MFKIHCRGSNLEAIQPNVVIYVATLSNNIPCVGEYTAELNAELRRRSRRDNPYRDRSTQFIHTRAPIMEIRRSGKDCPFRSNHRIEMESKPSFLPALSSLLALKSHHDTPPLFDSVIILRVCRETIKYFIARFYAISNY